MTSIAGELDQRVVEQFVYREARLADEHRYDEWEALWTDDALYWVPAGDDSADPARHVSVLHDNRSRISTRIKQLKTGKRHAQNPPSRLRRLVTNVEILEADGQDTLVGANFLAVEARETGKELWAGRVTYGLRLVDGDVRMSYKKVDLVDKEYVLPTLAFLI